MLHDAVEDQGGEPRSMRRRPWGGRRGRACCGRWGSGFGRPGSGSRAEGKPSEGQSAWRTPPSCQWCAAECATSDRGRPTASPRALRRAAIV
jgi:hypothetical protein